MDSIQNIPLENLALAFIPAAVVIFILFKWRSDGKEALMGLSRMLVQLLIVGFILDYIFETEHGWVVLSVLAVMLFFSSWISLRTVKIHRKTLFPLALISIITGGGFVLTLITQGVLGITPWYAPS